MPVSPGDIVDHAGERRVVVDVTGDKEPLAILRYPDDDPRRELDEGGGDLFIEAVPADSVDVIGHI